MAILLEPGKGVYNGLYKEQAPVVEHNEYPKHMRHPGFQPGVPDKEIKVMDPDTGKPTGQLIYTGSKPIRYADVLVHDENQEEYHKSLGYETVGTSDPDAFARAAAAATPVPLDYKPIQYPRWVNGKVYDTPEEEAAGIAGPTVASEGQTVVKPKSAEQLRIEELEAKLAAIEAATPKFVVGQSVTHIRAPVDVIKAIEETRDEETASKSPPSVFRKVIAEKPRKVLTPEHLAALQVGRERAAARRAAENAEAQRDIVQEGEDADPQNAVD